MTNRSKGTYNRLKTRKWYEKDGYTIYDSETKKAAWVKGRILHISQDLAGSDLIAMGHGKMIFLQSKSNRSDISKAKHEFYKHPYPDCVCIERHIVLWELRSREPEVILVESNNEAREL